MMVEKLGEWNNYCNDCLFVFQRETIISKHETILFFATLSFVMWVTLCLNDNQRDNDEEEVFEEFLDRVKRDAMPQPRDMHFYFTCIWLRSHRIP